MAGARMEQCKLLSEPEAKGSTLQLLVLLLWQLTETAKPDLAIPLKWVQSWRGIHDESYVRKQLRRDLKILHKVRFAYRDRETWKQARICSASGIIENSVLYFSFDTGLLPLAPTNQFMLLPSEVLRTQTNENLTARLLLTWRISQHKRMNLDRPSADLVPIRSLLECCPSIPAYKDLKAGQVNQRIIEPLEKALDKCAAFTWEYSPKDPRSYRELISSHLHITWATDPYADAKTLGKKKAARRAAVRKAGSSA